MPPSIVLLVVLVVAAAFAWLSWQYSVAVKVSQNLAKQAAEYSLLLDYLDWCETQHQPPELADSQFLYLAADSRTCWGDTYTKALRNAMAYDVGRGAYKPNALHLN